MFARAQGRRKAVARLFAFCSLLWVASCGAIATTGTGGNGGPQIDPGARVQVALLLPRGSSDPGDALLARDLENAARLAISDLTGANIDLRVYATGAGPSQAAAAAVSAVNDGAKIILGPVRGEQANAAGVAIAGTGVNLLAFSNNPTIAGGNVFILGATFRNTAERIVRYGARTGIESYVIVHADDLQGTIGRDEISNAVRANGGTLLGVQRYPLSQQGIAAAAPGIAQAILGSGTDAIFLTGGVNADLPLIATELPANGVNPGQIRTLGLTRWDAAPEAASIPGLQNGLFAIPDQNTISIFESRYAQAYGDQPHPLSGLAYDGIAAVGALVAAGRTDALTRRALTQPQGFQGTAGIFRLLSDGTNERGLSVATVRSGSFTVLEAAPRSFGGQGS